MLKFGIITEVNAAKGLARVRFPDDDNIVSGWLPMSFSKTLKEKFSFPLDINEHVWCLMDDNLENGIIGGAIYSKNQLPRSAGNDLFCADFENGLRIEYNRSFRTLSVTGTGDVNIDVEGKVTAKCSQAAEIESLTTVTLKAATKVTVNAPLTEFTGPVTVAGVITAGGIAVSAAGGGSGNATIEGNITVTGNIETVGGNIIADNINLKTHRHGGVQTGGGISGTPVP